METVVVLGASANPERYSYRAITRLKEAGHRVIPVHPALQEIQELPVVASLQRIKEPVDTLTVYVNPVRLNSILDDVISLSPGRVILNPGAESDAAIRELETAGIETVVACTLVMLATGQWNS